MLFPMGLDRNGLPIELAAEKEFSVSMFDTPREKFLQMCSSILETFGDSILKTAHRLGLSCNSFEWDHVYKTDQPEYRSLTQQTFIHLWNKGLIYEDDRPSNWDPILKSTIADSEIEYRVEMHELYEVDFLVENNTYSFATTRPELIPAIRLIIFNPDDDRYKDLEGKTAEIPYFGISVLISANREAHPEYGTGLVQICSFGDLMDIKILREMDISPIYLITEDGRMSARAGKYSGMTINEARREIVKDLTNAGILRSVGLYPYRRPYSDRTGAPIEFIGKPEYYLRQLGHLPRLRKLAGEMTFFPPTARLIWENWLSSVKIDWPISRRRFYGTEIPIWYCSNHHPNLPEGGKYYQPWKDEPPFDRCTTCGDSVFTGEERIFDTWMDSSVSALYISTRPLNGENEHLAEIVKSREFLTDIRPQGKDIVRTWLHYSVLRIDQLMGKRAFDSVWISGHILTEDGTKMSKRLGNSVDPDEIIDLYGADALRLYSVLEAGHGSDMRFNEEHLRGTSKFLTKLYNICRFVSQFGESSEPLCPSDLWIMGELTELVEETKKAYRHLDFQRVAQALRFFIQETFASHYIELVKSRAYNRQNEFSREEQESSRSTLNLVLRTVLSMLAPITPFITDHLYRSMFGDSVHSKTFPKLGSWERRTSPVEFNRILWAIKKETNRSLREPLQSCQIPEELHPYSSDLRAMHTILTISKNGKNEFVYRQKRYRYSP